MLETILPATGKRLVLGALLCASFTAAGYAATTFMYDSQPGDFIGGGGSATWTDAEGRWTVRRNFDNGVSLFFTEDGGPSFWSLDFAAPGEVEITPGFYDNAEKFPFQSSGVPGLNISGEGRACNTLVSEFSEFTVTQSIYDWYGRPVQFTASFEQRCFASTGSLLGSIEHQFGVIGPTSFAQDNILVIIENRMWEFTPAGVLIKAVPILESDGTPPGSSDQAKDLVASNAGGVHITHGLFGEGFVHTFDPGTGNWRHDAFANWENSSSDGIAALGDFVFVTEGFSPGGIVRFDTANNFAGQRFADTGTVYRDLSGGLDGELYALQSNRTTVDIFDPQTLASAGTVTLDRQVNAITVNASGEIFGVTPGPTNEIHRFDGAGVSQDSIAAGETLTDIDVARDGQIVAGGFSNLVVVTTEALGSTSSFEPLDTLDSSLSPRTYVAFVQNPPDTIFGGGFESGDTSAWTRTVGEAAGFIEVNATAARTGSFGLEVTAGGTCPFDQDLTLPPPSSAQGDFQACNSITASDVSVVAPGATFVAGVIISLANNFAVNGGAAFEAALDESLISGVAYVEDSSPTAEQRYHASFDLNLDNLTLGDTDLLDHLVGYSADGASQFFLRLKRNVPLAEDRLVVAARKNDGTFAETPPGDEILLPSSWNRIELDWKAGAGDGKLLIWVDDVFFGGLTDLTNDTARIDTVRWGVVGGSLSATTGSLLQDNFDSWR